MMMKKILPIIFMLLAFTSCSNDDGNTTAKKNLQGHWLWVSSSGGYSGSTLTPATTNQKKELEFSRDYMILYIDDKLVLKEKFAIVTKKSLLYNKNRKTIILEKGYIQQSFEIIDDALILSEECSDCYTTIYKRIE
ncbi:hypothetical protein RB619_08695 [Flavobacterium sp. LHD-80]|uniref:hypothetical protein n=1 Tax=Flavobacterium sp. LHD-80 TaxID=3071411 RepID=UPI0027DF28FA|nr:hypothetical protein [Flavobacterium sp. LHD-80]MDQ6470716.1 hypothetical protein [Flavobacterium sp. LHD-80]